MKRCQHQGGGGVDILYIAFPLGLNMAFLCAGGPLKSSCWKGRLSGGKSSCEKPLEQNKTERRRR